MSELRLNVDGERAAPPWVLVAGGFHARGGMDKANDALARYLLARGHALHLVAHEVEPSLAADARVRVHLVARPTGSTLLGFALLARRGRAVARSVTEAHKRARVVTNGGNCAWPDINWVHSVHDAWPPADAGAPVWFKVKNRLTRALARRDERRAITSSRCVVANSERTRRDIIERFQIAPERVRTIYLGCDESCSEATVEERAAARARLNVTDTRPLVAFVGALGHDQNKGFDTLWRAWKSLCARADWDADLVVAGGGRGLGAWRERVVAEGLSERVKLVGFTERVDELLAASDLLVSPVRYEAYGLNVHEAICRGVPALVSGAAGVTEHFTPELQEMILPDAEDDANLAARLLRWRSDTEGWRRRFAALAARLRSRTWADMAAEFVAFVESEAESQSRISECGMRIDERQRDSHQPATQSPQSAIGNPQSV